MWLCCRLPPAKPVNGSGCRGEGSFLNAVPRMPTVVSETDCVYLNFQQEYRGSGAKAASR